MMKRFVIMMLMLAQVATVLAGQYELISDTLTNSKIYPGTTHALQVDVPEKYKNVCDGIDELLARHGYIHDGKIYRVERENSDTVVLFCHFGVECVLLSHILKISPVVLWHNFVALPTSVTTLITEEREQGKAVFRCNAFGDISHLYAGDEPASFQARFCETYSNFDERH